MDAQSRWRMQAAVNLARMDSRPSAGSKCAPAGDHPIGHTGLLRGPANGPNNCALTRRSARSHG